MEKELRPYKVINIPTSPARCPIILLLVSGLLMVSEVRSKERDPQVGDPCVVDWEGFYFLSFLDEFFLGSDAVVLNSCTLRSAAVIAFLVSSLVFSDAIEAKL